jgi:hypothetical protein
VSESDEEDSSSNDKSSGSFSDEGSMKIASDSDQGSESGSCSSEEVVQVSSLAEKKKWMLPEHFLPKHHPMYKLLEVMMRS